jgi:hypothetical protein
MSLGMHFPILLRQELKQNIELCISNVTTETFHSVATIMRKRENACIAQRGGHFNT